MNLFKLSPDPAFKYGCVALCLLGSAQLSGCASTLEGAGTGALAGAAGGLVSGLILGGDPLESAARGAAVGAASGAVVGTINSSNKQTTTSQAKTETVQPKPEAQYTALSEQQLVELLGQSAVDGVVALAQCDYSAALDLAQQAKASSNSDYQEAGTWVQALTYAETAEVDKLNASYKEIISLDNKVSNVLEAQSELADALSKLKDIRAEHSLPVSCS